MTAPDTSLGAVRATTRSAVLLMPWGRVGSNLVNGLVGADKRIRVWNEPLTGLETRARAERLDRAAIAARQAEWLRENLLDAPEPVFLNVAAVSVADPEGAAAVIRDAGAAVLALDRRDVAATALSSLRAEAWVAEGRRLGEARSWSIPRDLAVSFRPEIPPERLMDAVRIIGLGRRNLEALCGGRPLVRYWYEDLLLDLEGTVTDMLARCGLGGVPTRAATGRFGSDRLADMVANAGELGAAIRRHAVPTALALPPGGAEGRA